MAAAAAVVVQVRTATRIPQRFRLIVVRPTIATATMDTMQIEELTKHPHANHHGTPTLSSMGASRRTPLYRVACSHLQTWTDLQLDSSTNSHHLSPSSSKQSKPPPLNNSPRGRTTTPLLSLTHTLVSLTHPPLLRPRVRLGGFWQSPRVHRTRRVQVGDRLVELVARV